MDKTDDKVIFSWYDADTFAEADRFCSTTNTFTNPDRWDSIDAIAFSTTGYYAPYGTHDYGFDDIEITSTVITQPYVPPVTYDLRFQSTLGNAHGGAGLDFDGSNDYIQTDLGSVINNTDQPYSISAWVKPDVTNTNQAIVSNDSGGTSGGTNFYIHSSNQLRWGAGNTGTQVTGTTGYFTAGNWYHVMATKSAEGVATIYINGVQDGQQTDW